jgi:hypothetical protein
MHADIAPILRANLAREARLMTDKASGYKVTIRRRPSCANVLPVAHCRYG